MLKESDISFVVCGLINKAAIRNIKRLKFFYPHATIILSVQTGTNITSLNGFYDKVVFNDLQSNYHLDKSVYKDHFRVFSYNKQQAEIYAGMKLVETKYAVRWRSDFKISDDKLLERFAYFTALFPQSLKENRLFKEKIMIPNVITGYAHKYPFYLSDLFAMGLTEDMKVLYHGGLADENQVTFFEKPENAHLKNPDNFTHQYTSEQFFFFNLLKKCHIDFDFPKTYCSYTMEQAHASDKILVNNFVLVPFDFLNIKTKFSRNLGVSYLKFIELYLSNISGKDDTLARYIAGIQKSEKIKCKFDHNVTRTKKHWQKFLKPKKINITWIVDGFASVFYAIKSILVGLRHFQKIYRA